MTFGEMPLENMVGKGKNADFQAFSPFHTMFLLCQGQIAPFAPPLSSANTLNLGKFGKG